MYRAMRRLRGKGACHQARVGTAEIYMVEGVNLPLQVVLRPPHTCTTAGEHSPPQKINKLT